MATIGQTGVVGATQTGTQRLREGVGRFDDTRLDQHLTDWDIDFGDQLADVAQLGRRVGDEQLVGSLVEQGVAAFGQHTRRLGITTGGRGAAAHAAQHLLDDLGALIVELETLGTQGLEIGDRGTRLQIQLLTCGKLIARRNPDDVAVLAHRQTLLLEDDFQSLVPRDIVEAQGNVAGDRIADNDIEVGDIGKDVQQLTQRNVLEVQRDLLALIALTLGSLEQLGGIVLDRLHLDDELTLALVGGVFPQALGRNDHTSVFTMLGCGNCGHRRRKIGHIELARQFIRKLGALEVDDQLSALLTHVDGHARVGQIDGHLRLASLATTELQIANGAYLAGDRRCRGSEMLRRSLGGDRRRA